MGMKKMNIEKVAAAIEADAGESLPDLRQALAKAWAGARSRNHTGTNSSTLVLLCHKIAESLAYPGSSGVLRRGTPRGYSRGR